MGYSVVAKSALVCTTVTLSRSPSGNCTSSLKRPPSQMVLSLPGMAQSHRLRSRAPCCVFIGRATKPNGWSLRHCLLCGGQSRGRRTEGACDLGGVLSPFFLQPGLCERHGVERGLVVGDVGGGRNEMPSSCCFVPVQRREVVGSFHGFVHCGRVA